jgi:hypothetical protein
MSIFKSKPAALALALAVSTALNLAAQSPAAARDLSRRQAYSEGVWREPGRAADPPAAIRGGPAAVEPVHGNGGKAPSLPALPPVPR